MGFLSGNTKSVTIPSSKLLGADALRGDTHEQAQPLPVLFGMRRLGVKWLSQRFNVEYKTKKDKKAGKRTKYWCSFVAGVCHGPVDRLEAIYFDGKKVWPVGDGQGISRSALADKVVAIKVLTQGENYSTETVLNVAGTATARPIIKNGRIVEAIVTYQGDSYSAPPSVVAGDPAGSGATFEAVIGSETFVPIEIEGLATWRFYWGMEDCDYDPIVLELSQTDRNPREDGVKEGNAPEEHPAYAGQCYLVAERQFLGTSRTIVQQIEIVVGRWPAVSWLSGSSNLSGDCNLAQVLADGMTHHRYGLSLASSRIDEDSWNAFAGVVAADGLGVSPVFDSVATFRSWLIKALEYVDGYYISTAAGKFALGLVRQVDCKPGDPDTPYYDETCLTRPPEMNPAAWESTKNQIYVAFTNRQAEYNSDSVSAVNNANLQITQEPSVEVLERPWFTIPGVADGYARAAAQVEARPQQSGTLYARKSRLQNLQVGGIFKLSWAHFGMCYLWARATDIYEEDPYRPEVQVAFEVDRGYLSQITVAAPTYTPPADRVLNPDPFDHAVILEMPYTQEQGVIPYLAALAARPNTVTSSFAVHFMQGDSGVELVTISTFAHHGTLDDALQVGDDGFLTVKLDGVDTELPDEIQGLAMAQNVWIALIGDEILSLGTATLLDAATHQYRLTYLRERFDTKREAHDAGAEVWIISTDDLKSCVFPTNREANSGTTIQLKLQPIVYGQGVDPSAITPIPLTYTGRSLKHWKPRDLAVNGVKWYETPGPSYSAGQDITITWVPNNRNGAQWEGFLTDLWWIEIRDMADAVLLTEHAAADTSSLTIGNATLIGLLGSQTDFKVRIYAQQGGPGEEITSAEYDEATVTSV